MNISNIDFLYSCFNQYLFQTAKENVSTLKYYFSTNPSTSGNALVADLVQAIDDYNLENIGLPLFQGIIMKHGKTNAEYNQIISDIMKFKSLSADEILPAKKMLRDMTAAVVLKNAADRYKDSPADYISYIKNLNFQSSDTQAQLVSSNFNSLDLNSLLAKGALGGVPSRFEWINKLFEPENMYPGRGIVMVSCPPGCGKSLFAMNEALNFALNGKKVLYAALADLNQMDFIVRLGAIYYGLPFAEVKKNITNVYTGLKKVMGDNLEIICVPAGTITAREFVDFVKNSKTKYDVVIADYDSNFKSSVSTGESLYLAYDEVYKTLTELTLDEQRLVFVLAQPQKASWRMGPEDCIELDQIGESSRKMHTADMILTGTREAGNLNGLTMWKCVKNRRGTENFVQPMIRLGTGRFMPLPIGIYRQLMAITDKRDFTERELTVMIDQYEQTRNNLNMKVKQLQEEAKPVKNPFS